jgi:hypothetical protein
MHRINHEARIHHANVTKAADARVVAPRPGLVAPGPCRRACGLQPETGHAIQRENGTLPRRAILDKSLNRPARSAGRLVIEATFAL